MRPGLSRLEMLSLLDELGTVRAVAASLFMSPSAVSAQLAVLSAEVGTPLLSRSGRRVQLTAAGRSLAAHARRMLDQLTVAEADLRALSGRPAGPVRLAAFSSAVRTLVLPLASSLRSSHPSISLAVTELDPQASLPALRRGEFDVIITADFSDGSVPLDPSVHTVPLLTDAIVLVTPVDRAADGPADPGTYLAQLVTSTCRQAGFEPVVAGRFASYELLLAHVEAGLSVSLLPSLAVDDRYAVAVRPLREPLTRHVYAAVRSETALTAATRTVLDALTAVGLAEPATTVAPGRTPTGS
jgi:DNA-binding transcriptional LysR family regulator